MTRTHQGLLKSSSITSRRGQRGSLREVYMESPRTRRENGVSAANRKERYREALDWEVLGDFPLVGELFRVRVPDWRSEIRS